MNAEIIRVVENIALVVTGWLLSILTTLFKEYRIREKEKRKLFTRLWLILETIYINLEISIPPALSQAGSIDAIMGKLEVEESWEKTIPPPPPSLPRDFDEVLEQVEEWESENGQTTFVKQLIRLRSQLELAHQLYDDLSIQEKNQDKHMYQRKLASYTNFLADLKQDTFQTLKLTSPLRFRLLQQLTRRIGGGE